MSVIYSGKTPERNYSLNDFYKNGIVISWVRRFESDGKPAIRVIFRSNGLLGEIRTTCYGDRYAVDVTWEWGMDRCLTTECKTIREAKSILFEWFKSKGYSLSKKETDSSWRKNHLAYQSVQLTLSPFVFK